MSRGSEITAGILAITTLAPWAVFLGGLCKLTDVLSGWNFNQALKQTQIMLEWYIVAAEFVVVVVIVIAAFARGLRRAHSMVQMWLAVNTALLIMRATTRITQINAIDDAQQTAAAALDVTEVLGNPLPYLRAIAAGQVATAAWNFMLSILVGLAGSSLPEGKDYDGQPRQAVMA